MYISKKTKLILAAAIPMEIIAIATAVAVPIVVFNEKKSFSEVNSSLNLPPNLKQWDAVMSQMPDFPYNPSHYTKEFFASKIANQSYTLESGLTINTNDVLFSFENTTNSNVKYKVLNVFVEEQNLKAEIEKEFNSKKVTYKEVIETPNNYFEISPEKSSINFVEKITTMIKDFLKLGYIQIQQTSESSNVEDIKQNELVLKTANNFNVKFSRNDALYYAINNPNLFDSTLFWYLDDYPIEFNAIATYENKRTIWNAKEAYPLTDEGKFDFDGSLAYQELSKISDKLLLPELTSNELIDENGHEITDEAEILKLKIKKFIFNPIEDPKQTNQDGVIIPNQTYQAVLVKVTLKTNTNQDTNIDKYVLMWQDLFSNVNKSILENAPEIPYQTKKTINSTLGIDAWPTAEELVNKNNWSLLSLTTTPKKGFDYKIMNVQIPAEAQQTKDKVEVTVKVTYKGIEGSREYKTIISSGIMSAPEFDLNKNIADLLKQSNPSDPGNLTPIVPTITIEKSQISEITNTYELRDKLNELIASKDYSTFDTIVKTTPPSTLPTALNSMVYVPTFTVAKGDKIEISYSISIKVNDKLVNSIYDVVVSTNF